VLIGIARVHATATCRHSQTVSKRMPFIRPPLEAQEAWSREAWSREAWSREAWSREAWSQAFQTGTVIASESQQNFAAVRHAQINQSAVDPRNFLAPLHHCSEIFSANGSSHKSAPRSDPREGPQF
jgi:hypothetical protein